jgi:hypothetical protein
LTSEPANLPAARHRNWITSTILIVIWLLGLVFVLNVRPGIPSSMLVIGTVFFIVLIPAMNELVNTIVRRIGRG